MTEPFTSQFGAIPRPEEPARWPDPPVAYEQQQQWQPPAPQWQPAPPVPHYGAPVANATVVNNIRMNAGGYGRYRGCNHLLHASLTLATCGLWAPVWAIAWLASRQH